MKTNRGSTWFSCAEGLSKRKIVTLSNVVPMPLVPMPLARVFSLEKLRESPDWSRLKKEWRCGSGAL